MMVSDRSPVQGPCHSHAVACRSTATRGQHTPGAGLPHRFGTPRLAHLHQVQAMTARSWAPPSPPSSRPHTGLVVSDNGGKTGWACPSASTTDTQHPGAASSTPGARGDNAEQRSDVRSPAPSQCGSGVSPPLAPRPLHDASTRGASRPPRSQDAGSQPRRARRRRPLLHRLQTPGGATP